MKNIYYMIWADALYQTKAKKPNIDNESLVWDNLSFLSLISSFYLGIMIIWINYYLTGSFYKFELGLVMPGLLIDRILSCIIQLYLPSIIFNYLAIFFRNKHLKIMEKYPSKEGKFVLAFSFTSIGLLVISAIIGRIFIN